MLTRLRTKLTVPHILYALSFLMVFVVTIWVAVVWDSIPETLPTHYGFSGQADAYGERGSAMLMTLLMDWGMLLFMLIAHTITMRDMRKKSPDAGEKMKYVVSLDVLAFMTVFIVAVFAYDTVQTARAQALGPAHVMVVLLGSLLLPAVTGLISWLVRKKRG